MATNLTATSGGAVTSTGGTLESRGFLWFIIIITAFILGVLLTNAVYFKKVQDNGDVVSPNGTVIMAANTAAWLFWFNVILAIVAAIAFFWSLIRLFVNRSAIESFTAYASAPPTGAITVDAQGRVLTNFVPGGNIYTSSAYPTVERICDAGGICRDRVISTGTTVVTQGAPLRAVGPMVAVAQPAAAVVAQPTFVAQPAAIAVAAPPAGVVLPVLPAARIQPLPGGGLG
ncbi:Hypothetical protein POVN_LOCUS465 [uncultured virus]|nr:Hypothetical protein POVN_LOCUS465 [uncultured virus]